MYSNIFQAPRKTDANDNSCVSRAHGKVEETAQEQSQYKVQAELVGVSGERKKEEKYVSRKGAAFVETMGEHDISKEETQVQHY